MSKPSSSSMGCILIGVLAIISPGRGEPTASRRHPLPFPSLPFLVLGSLHELCLYHWIDHSYFFCQTIDSSCTISNTQV